MGTGDALTIPLLPCAPTTTLLILTFSAANTTTTPTLSMNAQTPYIIKNFDASAITVGEFQANQRRQLTFNGVNWFVLSGGGGGPAGQATIPLGEGQTTIPGTDNTTPLRVGLDPLYQQTIPTNCYVATHTVVAAEAAHLIQACGGAAAVPFTLPTAGSIGFEKGNVVSFKDIGTFGFTLQTSSGSLQGIPVVGGVATLVAGSDAAAVSAPPNWTVLYSQPPTTPGAITCAALPAGGCPWTPHHYFDGVPGNSAIVWDWVDRTVSCPVGFTGSGALAKTAATGTAVVNVNQIHSGVNTNRGTFTWSASGTIPAVASSGGISAVAGDVIEFAFPGSADATLGSIAWALVCTRS